MSGSLPKERKKPPKRRLDPDTYYGVIRHTQLVSTDIFFIHKSHVLLGKRVNQPAKGWLFTPGCRAYKNERLDETCVRLAKEELGIRIGAEDCAFVGVYDHVYPNNFRDRKFGTHYVNVAYVCTLSDAHKELKADDQHAFFEWVHVSRVASHDGVHPLVKRTFCDVLKRM